MDLDLDELESSPTTARKSGRGGLLVLLVGIALGVAGTLLLPKYVVPLLPESLRGGGERVDGVVLAMGRNGDKLLLTVDTQKGAVLATFTRRVAEVELLVRVGDTLTLGLERYAPFVDDPTIAAVRKNRSVAAEAGGAESGPEVPGTAVGAAGVADTVAAKVDSATIEPSPSTGDSAGAGIPDSMRAGDGGPYDSVAEEAGVATD